MTTATRNGYLWLRARTRCIDCGWTGLSMWPVRDRSEWPAGRRYQQCPACLELSAWPTEAAQVMNEQPATIEAELLMEIDDLARLRIRH